MTPDRFEEILEVIAPHVQHKKKNYRCLILAAERLVITMNNGRIGKLPTATAHSPAFFIGELIGPQESARPVTVRHRKLEGNFALCPKAKPGETLPTKRADTSNPHS